jgi:hypothetical protein
MIAEATLHANQAIAQLAEENPGKVGLRAAALKPQQVINGVLNDFILLDIVDENSLKNDRGKRDNARCAAVMSSLWDDDSGDVEAAVAKYIGSKLTELMGPVPAPATAPAQGE